MHLPALIQDLAVILVVGILVSLVFQWIKQPVVLGYLLAGIIVGPNTPPFSLVVDIPGIHVWAELGVIFLMFSLGLEFNFKKLSSVGRTAIITGPFEALFMLGLGFLAGKIAGFGTIDCIFFGSILSISSTTIIIKALDELKLKKERFAELIFGVLIMEDLFGILLLVALSTLADGAKFSGMQLLWAGVKLILLVASWVGIGLLTIPRFLNFIGKKTNDETLTLLALALCLSLVVLSAYFNYSVALGAFLMGAIIGESDEVHRMEKLIQPLRDLFAAIFFVSIGMLMDPHQIVEHWQVILGTSCLTIVGKILSTSFAAKVSGQDTKTSIQMGFGLAQIGEFSFIIATLGITLGIMNPLIYTIAVAVSVITTFTTPYLIKLAKPVSRYCS